MFLQIFKLIPRTIVLLDDLGDNVYRDITELLNCRLRKNYCKVLGTFERDLECRSSVH